MIKDMYAGGYLAKDGSDTNLEKATSGCREYIRNNQDRIKDLEGEDRTSEIRTLISEYIKEAKPSIPEMTNPDGTINESRLSLRLYEDINEYGPITVALNTDTSVSKITDIYCDGIGKGRLYILKGKEKIPLKDPNGNILYYKSPNEIFKTINSLAYASKQHISRKNPILYAETLQGYRLTARDESISADIILPDGSKVKSPTFSIRLNQSGSLSLDDMIYALKTLHPTVGTFLKGLAKVERLKAVYAGVPGTGKTTLMSEVIKEATRDQPDLAVLTIERTPEMKLWLYDEEGTTINTIRSVVATMDKCEEGDLSSPTMYNLYLTSLREKCDIIVLGEVRAYTEIAVCLECSVSGQGVSLSMHGGSVDETTERLIKNIKQLNNCSRQDAIEELVSAFDIIICMKLNKRDRKIRPSEISEITKEDTPNGTKLKVNPIIVFDTESHSINKDTGQVWGYYKKVGNFTKTMEERIKASCLPQEEEDVLLSMASPELPIVYGLAGDW